MIVNDVINRIHPQVKPPVLPPPKYTPSHRRGHTIPGENNTKVGLALELMKRHMSNEGFQLFEGLQSSGYILAGYNLPLNMVDVSKILDLTKPSIVVLQDKREWEGRTGTRVQHTESTFKNVRALQERSDIFKLTIIKDAHQQQQYHRESADEIGCHAWITYYNERIVNHLAPYTRLRHIIRTYHTVDREAVPPYQWDTRYGCVISGARNDKVYPLRERIIRHRPQIPYLNHLVHPGYRNTHCFTNNYLRDLSRYRVSICTCSIYGYALRKIIESTACGCRVITDLPSDEVLPEIDGNLIRINPGISIPEIVSIVKQSVESYDPDIQRRYREKCLAYYDFRHMGKQLTNQIESLRLSYHA